MSQAIKEIFGEIKTLDARGFLLLDQLQQAAARREAAISPQAVHRLAYEEIEPILRDSR